MKKTAQLFCKSNFLFGFANLKSSVARTKAELTFSIQGKYVTDDYLKTFEQECQRLNADFNINIVSRGSSGKTLKKLQIGELKK